MEYNTIIQSKSYSYEKMLNDIICLKKKHPFIGVSCVGKAVMGKEIPLIKLGCGPLKILCNGSHHAREWITTPALMAFIEVYCSNLVKGYALYGYEISNIYSKCTIRVVPMVNPDGVNLVVEGLSEDNPFYVDLLKINNMSKDFSLWKANVRGVDLNRNYNAGWQEYKSLEPSLGISGPAPSGYSGTLPESEPETSAMVSTTRQIEPNLVLAFHAQGEEIFWDFNNTAPAESKKLAQSLSDISGYTLSQPDQPGALYAGYKDWFISEFNRPGFTIEVGRDKTPVPLEQFEEITEKCTRIILESATLV